MSSEKQKISIAATLVVCFLFYSIYLYLNPPAINAKISEETDTGKKAWQKYNCNACHQVYGLGGYLGPDLTNVYSLRGEAYIKAFLKTGTPVMPDFHLSETEMNALVAYLKDMDQSGRSDPRTFTIKYNGTIEQ